MQRVTYDRELFYYNKIKENYHLSLSVLMIIFYYFYMNDIAPIAFNHLFVKNYIYFFFFVQITYIFYQLYGGGKNCPPLPLGGADKPLSHKPLIHYFLKEI